MVRLLCYIAALISAACLPVFAIVTFMTRPHQLMLVPKTADARAVTAIAMRGFVKHHTTLCCTISFEIGTGVPMVVGVCKPSRGTFVR